MQTIFCRTTAKDEQSFFLKTDGKVYFIFSQGFRRSVKEHFFNGLPIDSCFDYSLSSSHAVRRTLDKLKTYIPYVEKEYGLAILDKTKNKFYPGKKRKLLNYKNSYTEDPTWEY